MQYSNQLKDSFIKDPHGYTVIVMSNEVVI